MSERGGGGENPVDPSDLARLYVRYAKRVYALALPIVRSREDAEDVAHDVFASVCGGACYDPARGAMGAFLTTMARSRALDRLRRRGRGARLQRAWHEAAALGSESLTPLEQVSRARSAERVRALLAELPAAERRVLEMAYYDGLTQREIAADLETPLGTVKTLSRRALQTLGRGMRA